MKTEIRMDEGIVRAGTTRGETAPGYRRWVLLLLLFGALGQACDFHGGVWRVSRLDGGPAPLCVEETLRQAEGVTQVTYARIKINRRPYHRFSYQAKGVMVHLDIERNRHRPYFKHHYALFNQVPPASLIAQLRPIMARVDAALEKNCGMRGLSKNLHEACSTGPFRSRRCPPM